MATLLQITPTFSCYTASEHEAKHIFKEIFLDNCYSTPNLPPSPFIIDAGANIGLFTLHTKQAYPTATILAFEPAPLTYDVLRQNLALHGLSEDAGIETHKFGLGTEEGTAKFTYYPSAPGNSTLFPDQKEGLIELVMQKFPEHGAKAMEKWLSNGTEVSIPIQRLSYFLREREQRGLKVERIDLLKMDVEGAEFDVLGGLDEEHWALVRNVVLEISDVRNEGALARMRRLLEGRGFVVESGATHPDFSEEIFVVKARRV